MRRECPGPLFSGWDSSPPAFAAWPVSISVAAFGCIRLVGCYTRGLKKAVSTCRSGRRRDFLTPRLLIPRRYNMRTNSTAKVAGLSTLAALIGFAGAAPAQNPGDIQITPFVAHAWCCERHPGQGNPPNLAIDGDITTFTWSTLSFTTNAE